MDREEFELLSGAVESRFSLASRNQSKTLIYAVLLALVTKEGMCLLLNGLTPEDVEKILSS